MTSDKGIFIRNIYYMLTYAFRVLKQSNYESISSEVFEHIQDLFAAILAKGIAQQLKQGLYREYVSQNDILPALRGKIDMPATMKLKIQHDNKLSCEFDELSENNIFNQILKTTVFYLLKNKEVKEERKIALKRVYDYLDTVDLIDPFRVSWSMLVYKRNNQSYEMLMNICYFVLDGMLQTTESGEYKMMSFSDEHMEKLYEHFILEYYRKHHPYLSEIKAAEVKWNIAEGTDESMIRYLPTMLTDVFLRLDDKILIIDAKYYGRTMRTYYDKDSLISGNLYQIYTYVKNQDIDSTGNVAGLLLYAKTDEELTPDYTYNMGGNWISVKTLDLNTDFTKIAEQLDTIVKDYFN